MSNSGGISADIRGVVFDSGGVLLRHRHAFLELEAVQQALKEIGVSSLDDASVKRAFFGATEWLAAQSGLAITEEAAAAQRMEYYRRILSGVGAVNFSELVPQLRERLEGEQFAQPFPEVREVLAALRDRGLKLGVLSDGWASTRQIYEKLDLASFFDAWTFSAVVGCCKPNPRIFSAAANAIGLEPASLLFVDDLPANALGAERCGWQAVWLNREKSRPAHETLWTLRDLRQLL